MANANTLRYTAPMPKEPKTFTRFYQFCLLVLQRFALDGSGQTAGSLTYTSLLAIVPLLTLGIAILTAFPAFASLSISLKSFLLQNMMPETASKLMQTYVPQFSQNAGKLTAIGTLALTITSLLLMQTIEHALNSIWHVRHRRPLVQRFLIYWVLLTLGPLLIGASLYLTSHIARLAVDIGQNVNGLHLLGLKLTPILLTVTALSLLYATVPNRYVPASHAWIGGLAGGLCFEGMKTLFSHYISHFSTYTVIYGPFAALPLFLLWIYLSWLTVLFGATLTATLPYYRQPHLAQQHTPGELFYVALHVLRHLANAQKNGKIVTLRQLSESTHAQWDNLEQVLPLLSEQHWLLRSGKGWALATTPDNISLRALFECLIFQPQPELYPLELFVRQPDHTLAEWMSDKQPS